MNVFLCFQWVPKTNVSITMVAVSSCALIPMTPISVIAKRDIASERDLSSAQVHDMFYYVNVALNVHISLSPSKLCQSTVVHSISVIFCCQ